MSRHTFKAGDQVAMSAAFLRSMGTITLSAGNSGMSTRDRGIGTIIAFAPDWPDLAYVQWDEGSAIARGINVSALVPRADINLDAHRAETDAGRAFAGLPASPDREATE